MKQTTAQEGRCQWANSSPAMRDYHDHEWGVPSHDDRHLFEMLILEGAQAGLSWATILNRRAGYSMIVYSLLEAVAIVDDHLTSCPVKRE